MRRGRCGRSAKGAVVSGVCQGLARYFALDVTLLRVIAVLLLLGTGGGMFFVYLALMLLMPYAPLEPGAAPLRWLPAKCRRFVEFLRAKRGWSSGPAISLPDRCPDSVGSTTNFAKAHGYF
jgi:phage shock protein PspC (stress-responsive transcriptional regulator)